ncbi:MAG: type II toxin-antitoxin system VapC family toxin [Actinobacteria bacterium]|nr:type II toxin-antitoxin system VapC family toxin [Actinomycetota bacterium]
MTPATAHLLLDASLACDAWQRFGKGGHPAGLNIIDCGSYALAIQAGVPARRW